MSASHKPWGATINNCDAHVIVIVCVDELVTQYLYSKRKDFRKSPQKQELMLLAHKEGKNFYIVNAQSCKVFSNSFDLYLDNILQ